MTRLTRTFLFAASLACAAPVAAQQTQAPRIEDFRLDMNASEIDAARADQTRALAMQAYLWGLPAYQHFRQTTEIKQGRLHLAPKEEPFGGWVLLRKLATPDDANNVMPNVDTLYGASYVLLDKQGPVVLSIPRIKDRYYSVTILDAYFNNFEIVGTRSTHGDAAHILILPPDFKGKIPGGFTRVVRAPTPGIALFQRIFVRDEADVPHVQKIQDEIRLAPLADWKDRHAKFPRIDTPEFDAKAPVRETRDPLAFFDIVNRHTCRNPPPADYAALVDAFKAVGLGPCATPPAEATLREASAQGARAAQALLNARVAAASVRNGWSVPDVNTGKASPDYVGRAVVQLTQIGSFPPEEAMYFVGRFDGKGDRLDGRNITTLTFPAGQLPPVDPRGFWSLTMYRASDNLLVSNPLNRYILRPSSPGLTKNADGSLTLYMSSRRPPETPLANWLPAPAGDFIVVLRAYLPSKAIQTGEWFPPALTR